MKTCWNCKHFMHTGGHGSYDWGYCDINNNGVESDDSCDKFVSKEKIKKMNPVKIEIVKKESFFDETKYVFMVHIYDNTGELIDVTGFKSENLAGRHAFEMEQYYKFLKEE